MIREQRRYRKHRAVSAGVSRVMSTNNMESRKEAIQAIMKMGKISDTWKTGRGRHRSASTDSDASGLSDLDHRLEDFSQETLRNHSLLDDVIIDPDEVSSEDLYLLQGFCDNFQNKTNTLGESSDYRTIKNFFSPPRLPQNGNIVYYPYDRSKYVWTRPASDQSGKSKESQETCESPKEDSSRIEKQRSPFKHECEDKVFAKVCENHTEILSLGWEWLKITVSIFDRLFHSCAEITDVDAYKQQCNEIEERMVSYIGSSNFESSYIPLRTVNQSTKPTEEIILFVLFIHCALVKHDKNAYQFLLGGIIGTMVYLFITFKGHYPKGIRVNAGDEARGAGGDVGGAGDEDAADGGGDGGDSGDGGGGDAPADEAEVVAAAAAAVAEVVAVPASDGSPS